MNNICTDKMHVQKSNKLSQSRYSVKYNKRVWFILANYKALGQKRVMSSIRNHHQDSLYCWLNVPIQNQNNPRNTSWQFYHRGEGNMFRESWTQTRLITRENISYSKCTRQTSLVFNPLLPFNNNSKS